jgi:hypothetical protein
LIGRDCWKEIDSAPLSHRKSIATCAENPLPTHEILANIPAAFLPFNRFWISSASNRRNREICQIMNSQLNKVIPVSCESYFADTICVEKSKDLWSPTRVRNFQILEEIDNYKLSWSASSDNESFGFEIAFIIKLIYNSPLFLFGKKYNFVNQQKLF